MASRPSRPQRPPSRRLAPLLSIVVACLLAAGSGAAVALPTTQLTVAKSVDGPPPTDEDGAPLAFVFIVGCGQAEPTALPELDTDISWAWMETFTLTDGGSETVEIPAGEDCSVQETEGHGADATTWQLGDDAPLDGQVTDVIQVPQGPGVTVTFTNTFSASQAQPAPGVELVLTAIDANVPADEEDGALLLEVSGQDEPTITYAYTLTNTGEEPLGTITLTDELVGDLTGELPELELDIGATVTVTATHAVTPEELASGLVRNVATTTAVGRSSGDPTEASDTETVFLVEVQEAVLIDPGGDTAATSATAAQSTELPRTGASTLLLAAGGLLLALLGVALALLGRRGQRARSR